MRCRWMWALIAAGAALAAPPAAIKVDYPADRSIFPPDFAAPTFLFTDPASGNTSWRAEVRFAAGPALKVAVKGERHAVGEIDQRVVAPSNEPPKLTPEQQAMRTWVPDAAAWDAIRKRSVEKPATIVIQGLAAGKVVSEGRVTLSIARDPVGAPVFFRDVPLMPSAQERGVIRPLPKSALPLVAWRLRYMNETRSRLMIDGLPTCMNCHSFSKDGKTLGLDVDGPANDKGLYALVPIAKQTSLKNENVVAWSSFRGKLGSKIRVGFMSQVSPDGRVVVTMVRPDDVQRGASQGLPKDVGNFYVQNFQDYRFLQVFYPTRGVLAWYSKETGKLQPLPGADDPRYVHTNATWSPDGKYLIFARAEAREAYQPGVKPATRANDPNETPLQYDLYQIPFNDGKGGTPQPVAGASANGMSNSFPKISPDGKWLVWVQAKNGLLMRPDGQLYIAPAAGGPARRMNCNTPLMNSWHSFSPNGRWMVFSSKMRSPYTQMYLTHIDEQGNDSPPILVENATAANRAVNIPEFVNVGADGWDTFDAPATDFYRLADNAGDLLQKGRAQEAVAEWKKALAMQPDDWTALSGLGAALAEAGEYESAMAQFKKAVDADPEYYKSYSNWGVSLARIGRFDEASELLRKALDLNPQDAKALGSYGGVLLNLGRTDEARQLLTKALEIDAGDADAHNNLGSIHARAGDFETAVRHFEQALVTEPNSPALRFNLGRALAARGQLAEGIPQVEKAVELTGGQEAIFLDRLSMLYAQAERFRDAASTARRALDLANSQGNREMADALRPRLELYESKAR
ncbi:MAG: tetratricopeptide repeat protein [Bryobacteraceae bacterium]|nr:tetratricopeptide repeat protein [Bryobacteraceae bacterium]